MGPSAKTLEPGPDDVCRVCFGGPLDSPTTLIAPCGCKGTQRFIHPECLRAWQTSLLGSVASRRRARICTVCNTPYNVLPPSLSMAARLRGAVCDMWDSFQTLVIHLPRAHLGKLWLIITLAFLCVFPALLCIAALCLLFTIYWHGIKPTVVHGRDGIQVALIRQGAPVAGVEAGVLLVSQEANQPGSIFNETVLFVLEHGDHGSLAVILNKPYRATFGDADGIDRRLGGPVPRRPISLHQFPPARVPRAQLAIPARNGEPAVYTGGEIRAILEAQAETRQPVVFFEDCASWAPGQLDGEIRHQAWGWIPKAKASDIFHPQDSVEHMWAEFITCPELRIVRP